MRIKKTSLLILIIIAALSISVWIKFSYPQLAFVDLSIGRKDALSIAQTYLKTLGVDTSKYKTAIIFQRDGTANRYLQKTIGFYNFKKFIKENDFDIFYWNVRFFKEGKKEEYRVTVSSSSGEIIDYHHIIPASEARNTLDQIVSKNKIRTFLKNRFNFNEDLYTIKNDSKNTLENRTDFSIMWQKKSVNIPWNDKKDSGKGKILIGATISGDEIRAFAKNTFSVPEDFSRYLSKKMVTARNLSTVVKIFHILLFIGTIYYLIARKNHLAMHTTKKFYIYLVFAAVTLTAFSSLNYFQSILFSYSTTSPFNSYLARYAVNSIISLFLGLMSILLPSLSGELLHYESFKDKPEGSFLYYIHSTFFSKKVAYAIFYGYLFCIIMLGLQAIIFKLGETYMGVWVEYNWIGQLSTAYFPFLAAITIAYIASLSEEVMYRMFAISWGKKLFKNTFIAVIIASAIWGFSHSGYPVFPMWFRGIEVTCLGIFISIVYLRFGIITVIVTHYLFDVFWNTSGYILGKSDKFDLYSCVFAILIPLIFAIVAYIKNNPDILGKIQWKLNKAQKYNLEILKNYFNTNPEILKNKTYSELREEIANNGWDLAVVEVALEDFKDKMREQNAS